MLNLNDETGYQDSNTITNTLHCSPMIAIASFSQVCFDMCLKPFIFAYELFTRPDESESSNLSINFAQGLSTTVFDTVTTGQSYRTVFNATNGSMDTYITKLVYKL